MALRLRRHLRHPHLVRDTGAVIHRLRSVRIEQGDMLLTGNVPDIFMSGDFGDLADGAAFYEPDADFSTVVIQCVPVGPSV